MGTLAGMTSAPGRAAERFPALAELPLVTSVQAEAGIGAGGVRWRVHTGRWQRLHPGVFVTHSGPIDWPTRAAGALLAVTRPDTRSLRDWAAGHPLTGQRPAGLAGWSAAYIDRLTDQPPPVLTLAVPYGRRVATPAGSRLITTRAMSLRTQDWPARTTVESTIVLLAATAGTDQTLALIGRALQDRRTTMDRVAAELGRWRRHPARRILAEILTSDADGAESALELRWVRDVERPHGIPAATRQLQTRVAGRGRRFDLDWDEVRLRVELDGFLYHSRASALVDRQKANAAVADGRVLLRYGWSEVTAAPCATAAELAAIAAARGAHWTLHPCRRAGCSVGRAVPGPINARARRGRIDER